MRKGLLSICSMGLLLLGNHSYSATRTVDLHIGYKNVNFTGKQAIAITANNQIPGPTLHFKQGDHVNINVYNHLDKGTAIHWHGILLPWRMDGVSHVTQEPIPPGGVFHYRYTLKQSGTYWYHAHADLQEQQGLYGAYIVDPATPPPYRYNKDFAIVLSDWTNSDPNHVYNNLKRDGDYYSPRFPLQPSLTHYIRSYRKADANGRKRLNQAYAMMQTSRMSPYDLSDVAYDAFLLNGHTTRHPWTAKVNVGNTVRLRFIDAGASTLFNIKIPGTSMRVVQIDGNNIKPYSTESLYMAPGETYDVLVKIKKNKPYIIYAESNDKVGKVYGALVTSSKQKINYGSVQPFPEPEPIVMMMHGDNKSMPDSHHTSHSNHNMPETKVKTKYQHVRSITKTNNPSKAYTTINMTLSGWMDKYVWFLNGLPEYLAEPILIEPGKRYRIIFKNDTMMHHPMHIHGHWFILRNKHNAYDPLLHTIDVPPNATVVADFDADAKSGFWYFHCHNLFHMKAGMANILRYRDTVIPKFMQPYASKESIDLPEHQAMQHNQHHQKDTAYNERHITAHPAKWIRANYLEIGANPVTSDYILTYKALYGYDFNRLQLFINDAEIENSIVENADLDIFYWRLLSQFWAVKGGVNYYYRPAKKPYWQPGIGIEGLMPYFIDTDIRAYYRSGSLKLDAELSRDTQIGNNFFVTLEARAIFATKTVTQDQIGSGLNKVFLSIAPYYRMLPGFDIFIQYEHEEYYGVTRNLFANDGEDTSSNTVTAGIRLTF